MFVFMQGLWASNRLDGGRSGAVHPPLTGNAVDLLSFALLDRAPAWVILQASDLPGKVLLFVSFQAIVMAPLAPLREAQEDADHSPRSLKPWQCEESTTSPEEAPYSRPLSDEGARDAAALRQHLLEAQGEIAGLRLALAAKDRVRARGAPPEDALLTELRSLTRELRSAITSTRTCKADPRKERVEQRTCLNKASPRSPGRSPPKVVKAVEPQKILAEVERKIQLLRGQLGQGSGHRKGAVSGALTPQPPPCREIARDLKHVARPLRSEKKDAVHGCKSEAPRSPGPSSPETRTRARSLSERSRRLSEISLRGLEKLEEKQASLELLSVDLFWAGAVRLKAMRPLSPRQCRGASPVDPVDAVGQHGTSSGPAVADAPTSARPSQARRASLPSSHDRCGYDAVFRSGLATPRPAPVQSAGFPSTAATPVLVTVARPSQAFLVSWPVLGQTQATWSSSHSMTSTLQLVERLKAQLAESRADLRSKDHALEEFATSATSEASCEDAASATEASKEGALRDCRETESVSSPRSKSEQCLQAQVTALQEELQQKSQSLASKMVGLVTSTKGLSQQLILERQQRLAFEQEACLPGSRKSLRGAAPEHII
eukprot:s244_g33.t3